jgi:hypothetical protein
MQIDPGQETTSRFSLQAPFFAARIQTQQDLVACVDQFEWN